MIYGGSAAYESKRKQKLITREINAVMLVTPKYLKWLEAPITFADQTTRTTFLTRIVIPWCWILLFGWSSSIGC